MVNPRPPAAVIAGNVETSQLIVDSLGSDDVSRASISGDHYGFPAETGRDGAVEEVVAWLRRTG